MTVSVQTGTQLRVHPPTAGLVGQFLVLAAVAAAVGLTSTGWLAATGYAVCGWFGLSRALHRSPTRAWSPANTVTLGRATLVGGVTALVADSVGQPTPVAALVVLATVALLLDAVDGQVARRTGTSSALGARFDMEVDAVLILVLSFFVAGSLGGWVLAIGALRYVFVAAAWGLPWLRGPLSPRLSRKVVAAVQGIALVLAASGMLAPMVATVSVASALALLGWSFGRDVQTLWRQRSGARPLVDQTVAEPVPTVVRIPQRRGRGATMPGRVPAPGTRARAAAAPALP